VQIESRCKWNGSSLGLGDWIHSTHSTQTAQSTHKIIISTNSHNEFTHCLVLGRFNGQGQAGRVLLHNQQQQTTSHRVFQQHPFEILDIMRVLKTLKKSSLSQPVSILQKKHCSTDTHTGCLASLAGGPHQYTHNSTHRGITPIC
jgi:hypothetical protein